MTWNTTATLDPRTRYKNAITLHRDGDAAVGLAPICARLFAARCAEEMGLEYVTGEVINGEAEIIYSRTPTPMEWAEAAEAVAYDYLDSYTVRNCMDPAADWRWEQGQRAAGLAF